MDDEGDTQRCQHFNLFVAHFGITDCTIK